MRKSLRLVFMVCFLYSVIYAESYQTNTGVKDSVACAVNDVCKSVHMPHSMINNDVFCCLNGQLPSVNMINMVVSCTCDPSRTMTPDQLAETLTKTFSFVGQTVKNSLTSVGHTLQNVFTGVKNTLSAELQNLFG
ncbi:uncharacterized protein LOC121373954 [Gigantopelta aegis]|uniref:uncharacterized protein LOC121373954 n=1 Tax=Gigantopelta aegis TaxID=1735272 RepID=UPI001B88AFB5|nr:uncharacterized protein LOC121373954 [Gigantopelta aegis]